MTAHPSYRVPLDQNPISQGPPFRYELSRWSARDRFRSGASMTSISTSRSFANSLICSVEMLFRTRRSSRGLFPGRVCERIRWAFAVNLRLNGHLKVVDPGAAVTIIRDYINHGSGDALLCLAAGLPAAPVSSAILSCSPQEYPRSGWRSASTIELLVATATGRTSSAVRKQCETS